MKIGERVERLAEIMAILRSEEGCPWDRDQTLDTLRPYLLEECYEVLDALESGKVDLHCEELGDLLFQVVFQSQIRSEEGHFDLGDVAQAMTDKLVRRHPHVFGDEKGLSRSQIKQNWERLKKQERQKKGDDTSALAGIPKAMPSLLRAERLGAKAASVGFDWQGPDGVRVKLAEEIAELDEALRTQDGIRHELGDVLFTVTHLCRHLGVDAELALQEANNRFEARFRHMETQAIEDGQPLLKLEPSNLEARWEDAKRRLN